MVQITFEITRAEVITTMTCTKEEIREVVHEILADGAVLKIEEVIR